MTNKEIKEVLLWQFKNGFDIDKLADLGDSGSESLEYDFGFEFMDSESKWHDVVVNIVGTIFKEQEPIIFHNPFSEMGGCGEAQGGEISISEFEFNEIEIFIDNKVASFIISESEFLNQDN